MRPYMNVLYYLFLALVLLMVAVVGVPVLSLYFREPSVKTDTPNVKPVPAPAKQSTNSNEMAVDLTDSQLNSITIEKAMLHPFAVEKEEVGSVAFQEKEAGASSHASQTKFVIANVLESDSPFIRVGQPVKVSALVYPGRVFDGKVSALGVTIYDSGGNPAIDPATHRIAVRCVVSDADNALYPGMLTTVRFQVNQPADDIAIPESGVVREGDGTLLVWVTTDRHHFTAREVKIGVRQDGLDQVISGLKPGELVVTNGALFLDNAFANASP